MSKGQVYRINFGIDIYFFRLNVNKNESTVMSLITETY